jgi:hypothetical protein
MNGRTTVQNSVVFEAKFICIRIFGVRMGHQVGQLGGALGQQLSLEETRIDLTKSETHGMYFSCRNPFSARHLTGGKRETVAV